VVRRRCEPFNRIGDVDEGLQRMLPEPDERHNESEQQHRNPDAGDD